MRRRDFLAAFPAFAALPLAFQASPWDGDWLKIVWEPQVLTKEERGLLMECFGTLNAAAFHGEPPHTVRLHGVYISAFLNRTGERRVE